MAAALQSFTVAPCRGVVAVCHRASGTRGASSHLQDNDEGRTHLGQAHVLGLGPNAPRATTRLWIRAEQAAQRAWLGAHRPGRNRRGLCSGWRGQGGSCPGSPSSAPRLASVNDGSTLGRGCRRDCQRGRSCHRYNLLTLLSWSCRESATHQQEPTRGRSEDSREKRAGLDIASGPAHANQLSVLLLPCVGLGNHVACL